MASAQIDQMPSHHAISHHKPKPPRPPAKAQECFDHFLSANTMHNILLYFNQMCDHLDLNPAEDPRHFYQKLRSRLFSYWSAQNLFNLLDKRVAHKEYRKQSAATYVKALVIGAGPCGLRCAIEMALLGAKVVVIEKRDRFSRNNVLHLWPFLIHDLAGLGAKKFFGKFCAGSIDHISIRTMQCILLKVALLFGVQVYPSVSFEGLEEPEHVSDHLVTENQEKSSEPDNPFNLNPEKIRGWRAKLSPANHILSQFEIDVLIGADGKRNTLQGFRRKEFRGKLAIAITANFVRSHNWQEAQAEEISGVSFIFNQQFFETLNADTGIDLENIVYYKDETHYFVMTAKKNSLLNKRVIKQDYEDPAQLLHSSNIDNENLLSYAREAAQASTNYQLPEDIQFALNHFGKPDVAVFDFTSLFASENASRVFENKGKMLVTALVGDSLHEPFWPTGSGCARGFLSALDAAWMVRRFAQGYHILEVIAERESIYQRLSQTTSQNMFKDYLSYTIDPRTRYPAIDLKYFKAEQVKHLFSTDDPLNNPALKPPSPNSYIINRFGKRPSHGHAGACEPPCDCDSPTCHHHHHHHHHHHPVSSRGHNHSSSHHHSGPAPISPISPGMKYGDVQSTTPDQLLKWLQIRLSRYQDRVNVQDLRLDTLSDGVAFLCLIHAYKPSLVDLSTIDNNSVKNCKLGFFLLEDEFGVEPLLSCEEMVSPLSSTDARLAEYLRKIYESLRDLNPEREIESSPLLDKKPPVSSTLSLGGLGPRLANEIAANRHFHHPTFLPNKGNNSQMSLGMQVAAAAATAANNSTNPPSLLNPNNKRPAFNNGAREAAWFVERGHIDKKRDILLNAWDGKSRPNENNKKSRLNVSRLSATVIDSMDSKVSTSYFDKEKAAVDGLAYVPKKVEPVPVPDNVAELLGHKKSELCHFCNRRVYIAERASAEGVYFHRNCLRCVHCNSHLLVTSYKSKHPSNGRVEFYCYAHADMKPDEGKKSTTQLRASIIRRIKTEKEHFVPQHRPSKHFVNRIKNSFQTKPKLAEEFDRHLPSSRGDASDAWLHSRLTRGLGDIGDLEMPHSNSSIKRHRQRKRKKKMTKACCDDGVDSGLKPSRVSPLSVLCAEEDFMRPSGFSTKPRKSCERISVELGADVDTMPMNEAAARPKSPEEMDEDSIMAHNLLSSTTQEIPSDSDDLFEDLTFSLDDYAAECFASNEENSQDELIIDDEAPRSRHYYRRVLAQCQSIQRSRQHCSSGSNTSTSTCSTSTCDSDSDADPTNPVDFYSRQDLDNPSNSDYECKSFPPKSRALFPLSQSNLSEAIEGVVNRESIAGGRPDDVEDVLLHSLDRSLSKTSQTSDQSRPTDLSVDVTELVPLPPAVEKKPNGENERTNNGATVAASITSPRTAIYQMAKMRFCMEAPKPVSIDPKEFIGQMNQKKVEEFVLDDVSEGVAEIPDMEPCHAELRTVSTPSCLFYRQSAAAYLAFSFKDITTVPCKVNSLEVEPLIFTPSEISMIPDADNEAMDESSKSKDDLNESIENVDGRCSLNEATLPQLVADPSQALSYSMFGDIRDIDSISINTENSSVSQTDDSRASLTDQEELPHLTSPPPPPPPLSPPMKAEIASEPLTNKAPTPAEVSPPELSKEIDQLEALSLKPTDEIPNSDQNLPPSDKKGSGQSSSVTSHTPSRSSSTPSSRCSSLTTDQPAPFSPPNPQQESLEKKSISPGLDISSPEDATVRKSISLSALNKVSDLYRAVAELCPDREPVTTGDSGSDEERDKTTASEPPQLKEAAIQKSNSSSSSSEDDDENTSMFFHSMSISGAAWHNRQAQMSRIRQGQDLQRHLREVQEQLKDLELAGVRMEKQLRKMDDATITNITTTTTVGESSHNDFYQNCEGSSCDSTTPPLSDSDKPDSSSYSFIYDQLVELMAEKERLMVTEEELTLQLKQFQLDEKLEKVQEEYQSRLSVEENYKSDKQKASDALLLAEYTTLLAERESLSSSLNNNPTETIADLDKSHNNESEEQSVTAPVAVKEIE